MELLEFLKDKKCPVTKTYIAERLFEQKKTPATMFHNKLFNVQNRKFTEKEKTKIKKTYNTVSLLREYTSPRIKRQSSIIKFIHENTITVKTTITSIGK